MGNCHFKTEFETENVTGINLSNTSAIGNL